MSNVFFLSLKKLTAKQAAKNIIEIASRHNLREMYRNKCPPKSIDPTRSHLNIILKGASIAKDVDMHANQVMQNAGINKIRVNAVRGIEVVFSLPNNTKINLKDYFSSCLEWAESYFSGQENVVSAVIHLDQANPHCHLLILPIKNNRLQGSDMFGKRRNLIAMHRDFEKRVSSKYQLKTATNQATVAEKRELAIRVHGLLKKRNGMVLSSPIWGVIKMDIERNPALYVAALGEQYFSDVSSQDKQRVYPQAFDMSSVKNNQTLSCVRV